MTNHDSRLGYIAWLPYDGALRYRVEFLPSAGGVPLETHIIEEARIPVTALSQPESINRVRIEATTDGQRWIPYVPAVTLVDRPNGSITEIAWEPSGAPAYRVVVRDDRSGAVVLKLPVLSASAQVSWNGLDSAHEHRYRIQEWRDGGWQELHPYRWLAPSAELLLLPPQKDLDGAAIRMRHFVAVRLSKRAPAAQYGELRPESWWEDRLSLLFEWTLASLTRVDGVVVLVDESVPSGVDERLRLHTHPSLVCLSSGELESWRPDAEGDIALTVMTAGDCLHPAIDARVRRHLHRNQQADRSVLTFPLIVRYNRETHAGKVEHLAVAPLHTVFRSGGANALRDELFLMSRPFLSPSYRVHADAGAVGLLRAWPGPNAMSPIHGEVSAALPDSLIEAAFFACQGNCSDGGLAA